MALESKMTKTLNIFPPIEYDRYLTKHEKLLEILEGVFRSQWSDCIAPKELEHNINEIMRVVRYNKKIKDLMEEN